MVTIDLTGKAVRMPARYLNFSMASRGEIHGFNGSPSDSRRFPGVIFLLLMVPLTHPEQIAGVAINLQASARGFFFHWLKGTMGPWEFPDYQVPPVTLW